MLRLEEILNKRGMSIKDLEDRMTNRGTSLSRISISKILKNTSSPKVSTLEDIAKALDLKITDMFYDFEEKEETKSDLIDNIIKNAEKLKTK